jgi:hypothetical protein
MTREEFLDNIAELMDQVRQGALGEDQATRQIMAWYRTFDPSAFDIGTGTTTFIDSVIDTFSGQFNADPPPPPPGVDESIAAGMGDYAGAETEEERRARLEKDRLDRIARDNAEEEYGREERKRADERGRAIEAAAAEEERKRQAEAEQQRQLALQTPDMKFQAKVDAINARGGSIRFNELLGVELGDATSEEFLELMGLRGFGDTLFDIEGKINPKFQQGAAGDPRLPGSLRQVGLAGGVLGQPKLFPRMFKELGQPGPKFRSLQAQRNMTGLDKAYYEAWLRVKGLGPSSIEEFLKQEQKTVGVKAPRFERFRMAPTKIRPLGRSDYSPSRIKAPSASLAPSRTLAPRR